VAALVVLQAAPVLTEDGPEEGSPEHEAAIAGLSRYWTDLGFTVAAGDYMVLDEMAEILA
jgi:hypothetical protein